MPVKWRSSPSSRRRRAEVPWLGMPTMSPAMLLPPAHVRGRGTAAGCAPGAACPSGRAGFMPRRNWPEHHADEGDAVAVLWVHVCLDLEDEACHRPLVRLDGPLDAGAGAAAGPARRSPRGARVRRSCSGRCEEGRRQVAGAGSRRGRAAGRGRAPSLLPRAAVTPLQQATAPREGIVQALHQLASRARCRGAAFHQQEAVVAEVVGAWNVRRGDRPARRGDVQLQRLLDLVEQLRGSRPSRSSC